jgi:crotonobetainyl-CoA:carnitine CoA-transferase CaiB-like acyl-CoA transferase
MFGNNKLNETQRAPVIWQRGSVMGALPHLQIVEIGSTAAASYCARLFADFGAAVQKVADRLVERSAIACMRIYSGDRSRLHRQASATIHAVP